MGLLIMILALVIGGVLTYSGISQRKSGILYILFTIIGIVLIVLAIILALPH